MKKVIFSLALFLTCSLLGYAQKGISYQAVILDPKPIEIPGQDITGQPFVNGEVSLKFKLFSATFVQEFEEVHVAKTDGYGLVNVLIGSVSPAAFASLVWDNNPRSMQVWVSFDQGGTYTKVSEQVLTYSPYSLYAETTGTAGKLSGTLTIGEGGTGAKTAANARTNLGLGNVDNTSDANKPVSIATQNALDAKANELTTYVNNQVAAIPDADAATKGKIQLAGDLGGTAASPTVPGLALKADAAAVNAALNLKANAADVTNELALKADAAAVNAALNLKANAVDVANELALKANAAETRTLLREKEIIENKSIDILADAASDSKYPTVKSIKTYVDTQVAAATIADADASTKGKIQLAGDLAGTADAPTVPGLALKANAVDMAASLARKANAVDVTAALAVKADTAYVLTKVAAATIADADAGTKGKIQLAGDLSGTAAAPTVPGLALKANASDVTSALATKASTSDLTSGLALKANTADVTTALNTKASTTDLTSGLSLKANTADMTAALALKAPLASPTFTGTVTTAAINTGALSSTAVTAPTYASAPRTLTYSGSTINWNPALGLNAAITLTQNSTLSFTAAPPVGSYGTLVLTQDGTGGRTLTLPTLPGATNQVLGSTSTSTVALSTAASSKDILNFYYDGTIVYWNIGQGYGAASTTNSGPTNLASGVSGTLAVGNGGTGATTATAALTNLGAAPLASPTFTGALTAPIYASTPQTLTDAATISWNPANGLNANVTLGGNRTLSFSAAPASGSYGTLVVTQDATGGRTLTLPSVTNKVLGSSSTTTIALSTTANAIDIVNFYYDGSNYFWNVGQGYGSAATAATTNLASGVTGTLPVANGGTGATTLTGYVKGTGTTALTASATIPVADVAGAAPLASPTFTGSPSLPTGTTGVTQSAGNNTTALATTAFVTSAVASSGLPSQTGNSGKFLTTDGTAASWASSAGVPYSGATSAVNLGAYDLTVNGLTVGKGKKDAGTDYQYNTALGVSALNSFTGGTKNTALGYNALSLVTNSDQNIAIGAYAMGSTSSYFQQSVAVGNQAMQYNTGSFNTAVGSNAATSSTLSGTYLVAVGALSLNSNTTGSNNTAVGSYALNNNTTGSNNTALGQGADVLSSGLTNATAIGYNAKVATNNTIQLGNSSITNVKTSGTITAGAVNYPNSDGTANQVLTTNGSGTASWTTAARLNSDEFTATAGQTSFTLSQTALNAKVFMFINGTRIRNGAYSVSGTTVTYTAANNNSYVLVAGDRIQFDYAY